MNGLPTRVISAAIALILLTLTYYFFDRTGIIAVGALVFALGSYEFSQIAFSKINFRSFKFLFLGYSYTLLFITVFSPLSLIGFWGVAVSAFIACTLWILRDKVDNENLLSTIALAVLGFVYCSLFPSFILRLLFLPDGLAWFTLLVAIVFSGDTFAYFGGILFGKNKLMPSLSPGKTVTGAVSGMLASGVAGFIVSFYMLPHYSLVIIIFGSIFASVLAQNGDLFESLIKRVAGVKDSGKIMPGHGGVLDRLDGVYFAAPPIYYLAQSFYNL